MDAEEPREEKLNWNPQWYVPLRVLALQVVKRYHVTLCDVDELVTIAWLKCASKFDASEGPEIIFKNRRTISGKMMYAAFEYTRTPFNEGCNIKRIGMMFTDPESIDINPNLCEALCNALVDPHDYVSDIDTVDLIRVLISRLSESSRDVLLYMLREYTLEEITVRLGRPKGQIERSIAMIRKTMQKLLDECE